MKKLLFPILRHFNNGEPSRYEARHVLLTHYKPETITTKVRNRFRQILWLYAYGRLVDDIAKTGSVTRERARQMIRKACRER